MTATSALQVLEPPRIQERNRGALGFCVDKLPVTLVGSAMFSRTTIFDGSIGKYFHGRSIRTHVPVGCMGPVYIWWRCLVGNLLPCEIKGEQKSQWVYISRIQVRRFLFRNRSLAGSFPSMDRIWQDLGEHGPEARLTRLANFYMLSERLIQ